MNTQCIVANNDIPHNDDLHKIRGLYPTEIIALTRHEEDGELLQDRHRDAFCSQDAWIFRSPMIDDFELLPDDIIIGTFYSDAVLDNCIYHSKKYKAWNLCNDVVIKHCHQTTEHDHNTKNEEETAAIHNYYAQKFKSYDWYHHLAVTSVEDYWNRENANKFISDYQFKLNKY